MPKLQKIHRPDITTFLRKPMLSDSVPFALLFLASRCSLLGISPFGVSMFCAAFDLKTGYLGLAAVLLGLASRGAAAESTKYIAAMLLFWLYTRLKENYRENALVSSVTAGALLFICGLVSLIYTQVNTYSVLLLIIESMICSFCCILFDKASGLLIYSRRPPSEQELISGAVCTGIFISGLSGIVIPPGIEISKIISSYAVMLIARNMSLAVAGSSGVAAGLICSMNDVNAITLMGLYGAAAMFGNLLKSFGKYGVALGFLGGCAVTLLYVGNSVTVSVIEILVSCLLFIGTPERIHKLLGRLLGRAVKADIVPADVKMREYILGRLSSSSHAFAKLAGVYRGATEKKLRMYSRDICTIIDGVTERVCKSCPNYGSCVRAEKTNAYRIMFSVLEVLENTGFCKPANAPGEFMAMCSNAELFLSEFSHVYELYKRDTIRQGEFVNNRDLILHQYEEISGIFAGLHDELSGSFEFMPELEEKAADELIKAGYSLRDIRILENGMSETEVFLSLNRPADKYALSEKLSEIIGCPMSYRDCSAGGLLRFRPSEVYDVEFGQKQLTKGSQIVSGDSLINFKSDNGTYYVILCDGMGSGSDAGRESRIAGRLLEEFLRDGFSASTAIGLVNSSLALGVENECFSSVDLLAIDLMTGGAEFYKIGGCKSFIKRGGSIETVFSPSLPVGILPEIHISCINKRLEDNDLIIMMSDGAEGNSLGFLSSERMKKLLEDDNKSMDDIAAAVINSAGLKGITKVRDDMTVAAIRIKCA